eukprot:TRINITY_DN4977_c0_g2_i1.p1 TRINITY_DN4977_c0_g2~~TRINITY_DN4977_c0_g2_i1.p1  ORF type:complete len:212 (-),score=36.19 TRINITY_DN4977_c0_g2_i1:170-805(-)
MPKFPTAERNAEQCSEELAENVRKIYEKSSNPNGGESFISQVYAENATYEAPWIKAHGINQIEAVHKAVGAVFPRISVKEYSVCCSRDAGKAKMVLDLVLDIQLKLLWIKYSLCLRMISACTLDARSKVIQHQEIWDFKSLLQNFPLLWYSYSTAVMMFGYLTVFLMDGYTRGKGLGFLKDPVASMSSVGSALLQLFRPQAWSYLSGKKDL